MQDRNAGDFKIRLQNPKERERIRDNFYDFVLESFENQEFKNTLDDLLNNLGLDNPFIIDNELHESSLNQIKNDIDKQETKLLNQLDGKLHTNINFIHENNFSEEEKNCRIKKLEERKNKWEEKINNQCERTKIKMINEAKLRQLSILDKLKLLAKKSNYDSKLDKNNENHQKLSVIIQIYRWLQLINLESEKYDQLAKYNENFWKQRACLLRISIDSHMEALSELYNQEYFQKRTIPSSNNKKIKSHNKIKSSLGACYDAQYCLEKAKENIFYPLSEYLKEKRNKYTSKGGFNENAFNADIAYDLKHINATLTDDLDAISYYGKVTTRLPNVTAPQESENINYFYKIHTGLRSFLDDNNNSAQYYMDAIRNHDLFAGVAFYEYLMSQYSKACNEEDNNVFDGNQLVPTIIYFLDETDVSIDDFKHIAFIRSELEYLDLDTGYMSYLLIAIASAMTSYFTNKDQFHREILQFKNTVSEPKNNKSPLIRFIEAQDTKIEAQDTKNQRTEIAKIDTTEQEENGKKLSQALHNNNQNDINHIKMVMKSYGNLSDEVMEILLRTCKSEHIDQIISGVFSDFQEQDRSAKMNEFKRVLFDYETKHGYVIREWQVDLYTNDVIEEAKNKKEKELVRSNGLSSTANLSDTQKQTAKDFALASCESQINDAKTNATRYLINHIKSLIIDITNANLWGEGWRSFHIAIDGESKSVPRHVSEIYNSCLKLDQINNNPNEIQKLYNEIAFVGAQASTKNCVYRFFHRRSDVTQEFYSMFKHSHRELIKIEETKLMHLDKKKKVFEQEIKSSKMQLDDIKRFKLT